MKLTKIIGFVAVGVVLPNTIIATNNSALAGEVKVSTPNVEAVTRSDGSVYINTGGTTVQVPSRRKAWTSWRYWRLPWQQDNYTRDSSSCRHSSYQSTSQVTPSSSKIVQSSISSNNCN